MIKKAQFAPVNPFQLMLDVFNKHYPGHEALVFFDPSMEGDHVGCTSFPDEDEMHLHNGVPLVGISTRCSIEGGMEVLAHELAHVACGVRKGVDDHDATWENIFNDIFDKWAAEMRNLEA